METPRRLEFGTEEERNEFLLLNGLYLDGTHQVLDTRGEIVGRVDSLLVVDLQEVERAKDDSSILARTSARPEEEPEDEIAITSRSRLLAMTTRFTG